MNINSIFFLYFPWLFFSLILFFVLKTKRKNIREKITFYVLLSMPFVFICYISILWSIVIMTEPPVDLGLMFPGVKNNGTPYRSPWQAEVLTFFASVRYLMYLCKNNSAEFYARIIRFGNYLSLTIFAALFFFYVRKYKWNLTGAMFVVCVLTAGSMLVIKNIQLGNTNLWLAGLVMFFLTSHLYQNRVFDVTAGISLATAIMIKPYLVIPAFFILFKTVLDRGKGKFSRQFYGALIWGSIVCFGIILIPDISWKNYWEFFGAVSNLYTLPEFQNKLFYLNNSMIKYAGDFTRITSALTGFAFVILTYIFCRCRNMMNVIPFFFITQMFLPIFWQEHLMGVFPAFLCLFKGRGDRREALLMMLVVSLIVIATFHFTFSALAVNSLLICLFVISAYHKTFSTSV
ncbi:hypothetical protein C4569_01875 [Candidatus Parcubacteria bacterium]|nr:MAG: hypothetical protein C4569_01875 [Candidatus Parcubacteria bacterium]